MAKAVEAFRTISEVADLLEIPKHVLRFWEAKFPQVRPMKRGGGRRYYRPTDVELLRGIRHLLQSQGYTIKGAQKVLRDQGVEHVKSQASNEPVAETSLSAAAGSGVPQPRRATKPRKQASKRVGVEPESARQRSVREAKPLDPALRQRIMLMLEELQACRRLLEGADAPGAVSTARAADQN